MSDDYRLAQELHDRISEAGPEHDQEDEGALDPMDEFPFVVIHPTTGDRAYADNRGGAELAQRVLRNEAVDAGASPRVRAAIIHLNQGRNA